MTNLRTIYWFIQQKFTQNAPNNLENSSQVLRAFNQVNSKCQKNSKYRATYLVHFLNEGRSIWRGSVFHVLDQNLGVKSFSVLALNIEVCGILEKFQSR